jgi:hypothetical protein
LQEAAPKQRDDIIWELEGQRDDCEVKFTVLEILRRSRFYIAKTRKKTKAATG